jgi:hypothetical protein
VEVVAQDMWKWWRRICGGGGAGYVGGNSDNRANSAQFQVKLTTGAELGNKAKLDYVDHLKDLGSSKRGLNQHSKVGDENSDLELKVGSTKFLQFDKT